MSIRIEDMMESDLFPPFRLGFDYAIVSIAYIILHCRR